MQNELRLFSLSDAREKLKAERFQPLGRCSDLDEYWVYTGGPPFELAHIQGGDTVRIFIDLAGFLDVYPMLIRCITYLVGPVSPGPVSPSIPALAQARLRVLFPGLDVRTLMSAP